MPLFRVFIRQPDREDGYVFQSRETDRQFDHANLSIGGSDVRVNTPPDDLLDQLGYKGWVGCEYRPRDGTAAGLAWRLDKLGWRTKQR